MSEEASPPAQPPARRRAGKELPPPTIPASVAGRGRPPGAGDRFSNPLSNPQPADTPVAPSSLPPPADFRPADTEPEPVYPPNTPHQQHTREDEGQRVEPNTSVEPNTRNTRNTRRGAAAPDGGAGRKPYKPFRQQTDPPGMMRRSLYISESVGVPLFEKIDEYFHSRRGRVPKHAIMDEVLRLALGQMDRVFRDLDRNHQIRP